MKREKVIILGLLVIIIILLGGNINFILEKNSILKSNKQIIKEMNESTQVTDLNNQINALNTEHTDYMNYIQTCKTTIATALTTEGVTTSNQAALETMAENISKVLEERTKNATATAEDIAEGKTAYVNGELITGNSSNTVYAPQTLTLYINNDTTIGKLNYSAYSKITLTTSGMTSTAGSCIIQNGNITIRNSALVNSSVTYDCSTYDNLSIRIYSGSSVNLTITAEK